MVIRKDEAVHVLVCPDGDRHVELLVKHLREEGADVQFFKWFGKYTPYWLWRLLFLRMRGYRILNLHWTPFDGFLRMRICRLACKVLGYRMALTVHNLVPHDVRFGEASKDQDAMAYLADWADALIVHCAQTKDDFIKQYGTSPRKIHVSNLANYIEALPFSQEPASARSKLGLPEDKLLILVLSPCRQDKGLDTSIHVIASLSGKYVGVVTGECKAPEMKDEIERAATDHPDKFIVRLGRLSRSELMEYYAATDIFFIPYKFNTTSGSVMEAMCYGKAIVAPPMGNIPFLVHDGENGYLASDPKEMAERIQLIGRQEAERMGEESLRIARQYTWDVVAKEYIAVFKDIMAK